jgi:hypothetical protein
VARELALIRIVAVAETFNGLVLYAYESDRLQVLLVWQTKSLKLLNENIFFAVILEVKADTTVPTLVDSELFEKMFSR